MANTTHDTFHVAIVGAGIGGLALVMALHKKGIFFTLYEEADEYSVVCAGIGFAPNGMCTMDLIEPGFRPLYEKACVGNKGEDAQNIFFEGMLLEEGFGRGRPWHGRSGWGHPNYVRKSAHRKALLDIMTSFIPIENVKFSKRLMNVEQRTAGVSLTFSDGTAAEAAILAGADGIKSTVREHVLKDIYPSQVSPVYAGAYCYRAVIPMSEAYPILGDLTDVAKFYFGPKRSAVTYRISGGDEFNYLLCVADSDDAWKLKDAVTEKITHETMMADFEGPGVDESFRQLHRKAKPVKWGFFHHRHTATYFRDRVVLVGDSAHASLLFQAAGAAQGLEDALVLSNVLAELARLPERGASQLPAIRAGLTAYDSVRRPRAQKQLEQAAEVGHMIFFQHEEAGADMEKILPRLQQERFNWLWFYDMNDDVQEVLGRMQKEISTNSHGAKI
ncbi:monooxygenase [Aspergillus affinis]|uniref:monooxygenase n=1 Tax=Aspergillus affinis TaxID=1070780 RepID=UPI0022FE667F|nr:monooxygenase [Aspergillus affinis]KAI9039901.1 monooxygenase [Aspergillus affinis]